MKQLTYHHILEKSRGGKATIENGAILSAENHTWLHQQSEEKKAELNNKFQEYKKHFKELQIEYDNIETNIEIKTAQIIFDNKGKLINKQIEKELER